MWQQLTDVMKNLNMVYEELIVLGKKKRSVLVAVNFSELEQILEKENRLAGLVEKYEQERQKILHALSLAHKEIQKNSKMEDLYPLCPLSFAEMLKKEHGELSQKIRQIREIRDANKFLVTSALSAVEYHLNRLGNTTVQPSYGAGGTEQLSRSKNFEFKA